MVLLCLWSYGVEGHAWAGSVHGNLGVGCCRMLCSMRKSPQGLAAAAAALPDRLAARLLCHPFHQSEQEQGGGKLHESEARTSRGRPSWELVTASWACEARRLSTRKGAG